MAENDKSIIDPKYRDKYKGASDWLKEFVDGQVNVAVTKEKTTTDEEGNKTVEVVETSQTRIDMDKLFDLAAANGIDARGRYGDQVERKNAPGRLRMTIGNMLRAAARKRHGLYGVDGEWVEASSEFVAGHEKTQNPDGSKIAKEKPAAEAAEAEAEGEDA